jgi:hypothetical protein
MIFLNGNIDVVTRILEFVAESSEELNTCAMISRDFRLSRSDPRFEQTRTGTITFKTSLANISPEVWQRWDQQVFTGNRVRLVAIFTQLHGPGSFYNRCQAELTFALTNVREVILQRDLSVQVSESLVEREYGGVWAVGFFKSILPNLDILDIGALAATTTDLSTTINDLAHGPLNDAESVLFDLSISAFRCTAEVVYPGCKFWLIQPYIFREGIDMNRNRLREIHIDPFGVYFDDEFPPITAYCMEYSQLEQEEWFDNANGVDLVLLQEYPNLERVTLKHAAYLERYDFGPDYWKELPQEALTKFVRHTPRLRWFRSDLTQENIAMLKEEFPEVEFCN